MRSLSTHLREQGSHAHLPFHTECPICRAERMVGSIPAEAVLSRRTRAALAAAVLAASGGPGAIYPALSLAGEPTSTDVGDVEEGPDSGSGDADTNPDTDTGPQEEDGMDTEDPVEVDPDSGDDSGSDAEESPDVRGPDDVTPEEIQDMLNNQTPDPPAAPTPPSEQQSSADGSGTVKPEASPAPEQPSSGSTPAKEKRSHKATKSHKVAPAASPRLAPQAPAVAAPAESTAPQIAQADPAPASDEPATPATNTGGPTHVVKPGDTLWSIAEGVLGKDAGSAAVAREVHKLWQLNAARIGTGSPDLIVPGQVLLLR